MMNVEFGGYHEVDSSASQACGGASNRSMNGTVSVNTISINTKR